VSANERRSKGFNERFTVSAIVFVVVVVVVVFEVHGVRRVSCTSLRQCPSLMGLIIRNAVAIKVLSAESHRPITNTTTDNDNDWLRCFT
jgi:hypothetical protein